MKKSLSLLSFAALLLAAGCSDEVSTTGSDESNAKARVTVIATGVDNVPLEAVTVRELASQEKKTTKAGRAVFEDLTVGAHRFTLSADGYATLVVDVDVAVDGTTATMDETAIVRDQDHIQVTMSRATVSAKGRVMRDGADVYQSGSLVPAVGATVVLLATPTVSGRPHDEFLAPFRRYETETDSEGRYSFEGLPEFADYAVRAEHRIDLEHVWRAASVGGGNLLDNGIEVFEDMILAVDQNVADDSLTVIATNFTGRFISAKDSLVLTTNRRINRDDHQSAPYEVRVREADGVTPIAVNATIEGDKIVVKPALSSWENNRCYVLHFESSLADRAGVGVVAGDFGFCVSKTAVVSGFEFDSAFTSTLENAYVDDCLKKTAATARLNWTPSAYPVGGKGFYELYVSDNDEKDYKLVQTIAMNEADSQVQATVDLPALGADVAKVKFQIRSCWDTGVSAPIQLPCGDYAKKAVELEVCED